MNDGHSRYYGVESAVRWEASNRLSFEGSYSYLLGRDLNPNRPVRRLPPQQGGAGIRYTIPRHKLWLELSGRFAGAQPRLAGGDLDDDRMGASRSRNDIATFFNGGMAAAYITPGPDGRTGTADDVFGPTGETLSAIQNRLLPLGSTVNGVAVTGSSIKVPMYVQTDGWWSVGLRGGVALREGLELRFGISNLLDRNYRIHGSGIDAAGVDVLLGIGYRF
jgi:outer membrane receptor protein involved in Fe transport